MNSKDTKTSRELKREVLQELNQVNNDIDRIQGRMTPGQFIDDALFTPVGRNPRAIFDHLKSNPIGTAFLGLGTLLLMEDDSHVTYETQIRNRTSSVYENTRYQATLLKGSVSNAKVGMNDKVTGVNDKIHGVIDGARAKVQSLKGKMGKGNQSFVGGTTGEADLGQGGEIGASSIDTFKDNLTENIGDVKENITGGINALSDNISNVKEDVTNRFDSLATDVKESAVDQVNMIKGLDPMTYAALGAGLGALTGIALPVSDREQMMIDQKASGKLTEFSSEFQDALNKSVKVLKDEFLGKFTDFDVSIFGRKNQGQQQQGSNQNFSNENPQF